METFSALLALFAGNSPVTGAFHTQRPVTRSFHVSFDLRLNQRLSKQWGRRWFETLSRSLWRLCNYDTVARHSHAQSFVEFCCGMALVYLTSIIQDCFTASLRAGVIRLPNASEVIRSNMGEVNTWIYSKTMDITKNQNMIEPYAYFMGQTSFVWNFNVPVHRLDSLW